MDLEPLFHEATVAGIELGAAATCNERRDPLSGKFCHEVTLRGNHGEDLAVDLECA